MGQMLIRNLDDALIDRLKARARDNHSSAEEEARRVLAASLGLEREALQAEAKALRARTGRIPGPSSLELLHAGRERDMFR